MPELVIVLTYLSVLTEYDLLILIISTSFLILFTEMLGSSFGWFSKKLVTRKKSQLKKFKNEVEDYCGISEIAKAYSISAYNLQIDRLFPVKRSDGKSMSKDHVLIMSDAMWKVQRNLFLTDEDNNLEGNI